MDSGGVNGMAKILNVYGASSTGKTGTLLDMLRNGILSHRLVPILQRDYGHNDIAAEEVVFWEIGERKDMYGLYRFVEDGSYIIVGTAGDDEASQNILFELYNEYKDGFDISTLIVPSRSRGRTGENVYSMAQKHGMPVLEYAKGHLYQYTDYPGLASDERAEAIYEIVNAKEAEIILALAKKDI